MVFKFTINNWVNHYIPNSQLDRAPWIVRRVLGRHDTRPHHDYLVWLEILLGTFVGLLLIEGVFRSHTVFSHHHAPIIIASYGASAILVFNASQAPLAQPRNVIMGHFIASLIGVCLQKLFEMGATDYLWIGGALSVGIASVMMSIFDCVHPPAGASALLPLVDDQIREMGWWYLPAQLVSSVLIVAVACISGNVLRKYPVYWWTSVVKEAPQPQPELVPEKVDTKESESSVSEEVAKVTYTANLRIEITAHQILVPQALEGEVDLYLLNLLSDRLKALAPQEV
ncbi:uncharacterized protein CANTADRAFT_20799 [Suhomyces tanzawaensis NRRL Y-17324]|uniref:HPP transmembrane region domain-containing protein n=1 Tax=Suhomyces tanzawaensis NRRL Y-17324 TaxID=984487 RepID=A0A1E4SP28_9ASCO|nr:uncharacterized protein CANTADRAFT_20799 [Suhomyces tanzawaensis NRRL Y-17324]ODV81273.1 hypothetical protein CANTADRAFT_20799 [Suhomyces tanzawaensis NRRL Y-17324]